MPTLGTKMLVEEMRIWTQWEKLVEACELF